MTHLTATIGYVIAQDDPHFALFNEDRSFAIPLERVHGQHPYVCGKLNKQQIIKMRDFLNEVLSHEKA